MHSLYCRELTRFHRRLLNKQTMNQHARHLHTITVLLGLLCPAAFTGRQAFAEEVSAPDPAKPLWDTMHVPELWDGTDSGPYADYDGIAWYRCLIDLSEAWRKAPLELFVEKVNDAHEVYLNGVLVGGAGRMPPEYSSGKTRALRYKLDSDILRSNSPNLLAVRVYDHGGPGGFKGLAPALFNERMVIDLTGTWQFRTGDNLEWAAEKIEGPDATDFLFSKVVRAAEIEPRVTEPAALAGALTPAQSASRFHVSKGLQLNQVLSEPAITQPLFMDFDERGRLWLAEYRQYPHPAGIKMLSRDNFWRAVYDRIPPPPPNHFVGKDRISIHEDTNGDGRYDSHKIFVDGLNIATSFARGRGGVWVLNPPYLLFYPDRDGDDSPDCPPQVRLSGFGIEDSHAVANNLCWGPDGWLYGCQGSTVSGAIVRPGKDKTPVHSMGQVVWRYHPENDRYEIFAEGGGNAFGCEIDAQGRTFSGHNGGDTRGFHYVQGGYYQKGFGKHGVLSNPYAFGFFPHMGHHAATRFTHSFIIYDGHALPDSYRGKLFGVEPLQNQIVASEVLRDRSSFKTNDLERPVTSDDKWFRPVSIKAGPDGAIYIADWYDQQVNHYRNHEGKMDPHRGRVYRLTVPESTSPAPFDLSNMSSDQLVGLLSHPNKWHRRTALRLLGDRKDSSLSPILTETLRTTTGQLALELLWALNLCNGLTESVAMETLAHAEPQVRLWTVRLLCDTRSVTPAIARRLADLAGSEKDIDVRSQLACSSRRLQAADGLAIVRQLIAHDEDAEDIHIPLLVWWTIEAFAENDREQVVKLFEAPEIWTKTLVKDHLSERLMRRFAQAGRRKDLLTCARLFHLAPDDASAQSLLKGFEKAYEGRSLAGVPDELLDAMERFGGGSLALRLRRGDADAVARALNEIKDDQSPIAKRIEYVQILGQVRQPQCIPVLLNILKSSEESELHRAVLTSLQSYDDPTIAAEVTRLHDGLAEDVKLVAQTLLASRVEWSRQLLAAVDTDSFDRQSLSLDVVRKMLLHGDKRIEQLVVEHWGQLVGATTSQIQEEINRLAGLIESGHGSPYRGKALYRQQCGKCHQLFNEGGQIGPSLTAYKRDDIAAMLLNVVNPSAEIREGFENYLVQTEDGRTLSGFIVDQDNRVITLKGIDGQSITLDRDDIEVMRAVDRSVMPEGLLKSLDETEVRDLFAYLRSSQPLSN